MSWTRLRATAVCIYWVKLFIFFHELRSIFYFHTLGAWKYTEEKSNPVFLKISSKYTHRVYIHMYMHIHTYKYAHYILCENPEILLGLKTDAGSLEEEPYLCRWCSGSNLLTKEWQKPSVLIPELLSPTWQLCQAKTSAPKQWRGNIYNGDFLTFSILFYATFSGVLRMQLVLSKIKSSFVKPKSRQGPMRQMTLYIKQLKKE